MDIFSNIEIFIYFSIVKQQFVVDCNICLVILYYLKYCYVKPSLHLAIFWCQMIYLCIQILCMSPTITWISKVICLGRYVLWRFVVRDDCWFCWYWWNCWSSLLNSLVLILWCFCHFQKYFRIILWWSVSFVDETGGPEENHWQILSHNVLYLTLIEIRTHNISGYRHWLHKKL